MGFADATKRFLMFDQPYHTVLPCTIESAKPLLARLRGELPGLARQSRRGLGGRRRDFRRWTPPDGVTVEIYDNEKWREVMILDCGAGGVRIVEPLLFVAVRHIVVRLCTPDTGTVLVIAEIVWRNEKAKTAGLHFLWDAEDDRTVWHEGLVEALLSRHALS